MNRFEGNFEPLPEGEGNEVKTPEQLGIDVKYAAPEDFEEGGPLFEWAKSQARDAYKNFWIENLTGKIEGRSDEEIDKIIGTLSKDHPQYGVIREQFVKYHGVGDPQAELEEEVIKELKSKSPGEQSFVA